MLFYMYKTKRETARLRSWPTTYSQSIYHAFVPPTPLAAPATPAQLAFAQFISQLPFPLSFFVVVTVAVVIDTDVCVRVDVVVNVVVAFGCVTVDVGAVAVVVDITVWVLPADVIVTVEAGCVCVITDVEAGCVT